MIPPSYPSVPPRKTAWAAAGAILCVMSAGTIFAQSTWTGVVDSQWGTAGNWGPASVPASGSNLFFNEVSNQLVDLGGGSRDVGSLTISSGQNYLFQNGTLGFPVGGGATVLSRSGAGSVTFQNALNFGGAGNYEFVGSGSGETVIAGDVTAIGATSAALRVYSGKVRLTGATAKTFGAGLSISVGSTSAGAAGTLVLDMSNQTAQNSVLGGVGEVSLQWGTLEIAGFDATIASNIVVGSNNGFITGAKALTINGSVLTSNSRTISFSNTGGTTINGTVSIASSGSREFTFNATTDVVVNGEVKNVSASRILSFEKRGAGTVTFNYDNAYTGTTSLVAGTLLINGDQTLATGAVTVAAAATLGGSGIVGGATTMGGTIAPGESVGELGFSKSLEFANLGTYQWEISDWNGAEGTGWDHIDITGTNQLNITGDTFTIDLVSFGLTGFDGSSKQFVIATAAGGITGFDAEKFVLNTEGFTFGDGAWSIAESGNSLVLNYSVIPEPGSMALVLFGLTAAAGVRVPRRRWKSAGSYLKKVCFL